MTRLPFTIIGYNPAYKQAFHDLNVRWLEKYFTVEPAHKHMLENPEAALVDGGGNVFFAVQGDAVIGTIAIRNAGNGIYELTKLAVSSAAQGMGIGRLLCERVIDFFHSKNGTTLYLETHKKLQAALRLYETLNFKALKNPGKSHYEGCDIYMELHVKQTNGRH